MNKFLNNFAVWLYKKTKKEKEQPLTTFLSGLRVIESPYLPKGTCIIASEKRGEIQRLAIREEIENIELKSNN